MTADPEVFTTERYLREKRKINCRLPTTLGFLPARGEYAPAMIAAPISTLHRLTVHSGRLRGSNSSSTSDVPPMKIPTRTKPLK